MISSLLTSAASEAGVMATRLGMRKPNLPWYQDLPEVLLSGEGRAKTEVRSFTVKPIFSYMVILLGPVKYCHPSHCKDKPFFPGGRPRTTV